MAADNNTTTQIYMNISGVCFLIHASQWLNGFLPLSSALNNSVAILSVLFQLVLNIYQLHLQLRISYHDFLNTNMQEMC